ncbi:MAG: magnesium transporter [Candidatus Sumerlaeota bacterium]|nr:magnesium transporter [Candidatus Sumerlaeota bacterium]
MGKAPLTDDLKKVTNDIRKVGEGIALVGGDIFKAVNPLPYFARPDRIVTTGFRKLVELGNIKVGLPPGSLVPVGEDEGTPMRMEIIEYGPQLFRQTPDATCEAAAAPAAEGTVKWVRVTGLGQPESLRQLGDRLGIHPLILEDILNTGHRPKVEESETSIFIVMKVFVGAESSERPISQISLLLIPGMVLSFHESEDRVAPMIIERLKSEKSRLRSLGPDALVHALLDTTVDHFFPALTAFGELAENLELDILDNPRESTMRRIQQMKAELMLIRRAVVPLRDMAKALDESDSDLIGDKTRIYLKDVQDHAIHAAELVETFRDVLSVLTDLYFSSVSHRMNNVMKTLTLVATIFMPLTLLVGIYGMNFENMPELGWKYGYQALWLIMIVSSLAMLAVFKKKKWLE